MRSARTSCLLTSPPFAVSFLLLPSSLHGRLPCAAVDCQGGGELECEVVVHHHGLVSAKVDLVTCVLPQLTRSQEASSRMEPVSPWALLPTNSYYCLSALAIEHIFWLSGSTARDSWPLLWLTAPPSVRNSFQVLQCQWTKSAGPSRGASWRSRRVRSRPLPGSLLRLLLCSWPPPTRGRLSLLRLRSAQEDQSCYALRDVSDVQS